MTILKKLHLLLVAATMLLVAGCDPRDIDTIGDQLNQKGSVNGWAYQLMNDAYFWYDEMPALNALDTTASPDVFFENLVYQRKVYDRFSLITDDIDAVQGAFNGVVEAFGVNYVPAYVDNAQKNVALFVSHVIGGSPAAKAGIERGDIIAKIDGQNLTAENYANAMNTKQTVTFTMARVENGTLVNEPETVQLSKARITEDPVAFSSVIKKGAKTIGYLVYTQFVPGTEQEKEKYDTELRTIFGSFKAAGVNELVLDLRLNGGGYMTSAVTLGSLIVPGYTSSKIFYKEQWNDKYMAYWKKEKGNDALNYKFSAEPNNIGSRLSRVYILTSNATASASELIINGLDPYVDVVTIGDHTAGKNLFGSLIGDDKKRWKYGIYMMLGQTTNANDKSDYGTVNGFTPTVSVKDDRFPFLAFGDENETLLHAALVEMGVASGARLNAGATTKATAISPKPLRDIPSPLDGQMIRPLTLP